MKIWYQSFVDPTAQAAYFRALGNALTAAADPGVTFELHGIVPPDQELNRVTEFRCARQVVRNAITAEQTGYDAFAIGHFQDGGLYEARVAVRQFRQSAQPLVDVGVCNWGQIYFCRREK
jgi:allantoin racemase